MRGYLKSSDGIFQLAPKVTTVGREGCDLVVQNVHVDFQHAVIEYSENEDCFVLQDLNSAQGTYVNDCQVQNAAVRLAPGDVIRFGYNGTPYELVLEQHTQMSYPPVHQRPAWTQPLTVISDPLPPQIIYQETLPHLRQVVTATTATWENGGNNTYRLPQQSQTQTMPRPPSATTIRSRPLSAGAIRSSRVQSHTQQPRVDGWVHNARRNLPSPSPGNQQVDIVALQEKHNLEQRILRLQDEVKRLQMYEQECFRKEDLLYTLRQEVADLQVKVRRFETSQSAASYNDADLTQKLMQLEGELQQKRHEIQILKDQLNRSRADNSRPGSASTDVRAELSERVHELNSVRAELERVQKDKNITAGLVTQMQRDMANKDTSIGRLTAEIASFKKEIQEKELQIQQLHSKLEETLDRLRSPFFPPNNQSVDKWHKSPESRQRADDLDQKEREAAQLRVQIKQLEVRNGEQASIVDGMKLELEKVRRESSGATKEQQRLQKDLDAVKVKLQDLERAERQVRVDLEQNSKRMERFRSRVVQVTFSTPGIKAPETEISDDELLETLKKIIDQRTELQREVGDLKEMLQSTDKGRREIIENSKKLKDQLNQTVDRLREKGFLCCHLRQELDLVGTISAHESLAWVRDSFKALFETVLGWEGDIEAALEECQINVKISDDAPAKHMRTLREQHVEVRKDRDALRRRVDELGEEYAKDMAANLETLSLEMEEKAKMEMEKAQLEFEEKLNKSLDEVRQLEAEKHEATQEEQRVKITELEAHVEKLKENILANKNETADNKSQAAKALEQLEACNKIEAELRKKVTSLKAEKASFETRLEEAVKTAREKQEAEILSYEEQIRQHSVTICAMEERLNKVVKKNKDCTSEISTLKSTVTDLREKLAARPEVPPKPKVIIQKPAQDVVAMEGVIAQLRGELHDAHSRLQSADDVIMGLRRDLAGASAKLTDMKGELSESQKEEMERQRQLVQQQDSELTECRQQLAKLSELVDKQSVEIKELNNDLTKQRTALNKYKNAANERESQLKSLEGELKSERDSNRKNIGLLEEEGRITSELTALGSQCRGERHESVIARQRQALAELRARVKALEMSNPPLPTKDNALQQVVLLKKELSELRASQALQETLGTSSSGVGVLAEQVSRARGINVQSRADMDVERSAHRETMEALELSEQSYLTLLRGVACALEMDDVAGLRSIAHIPRDEREKLARDRGTSCELVSSRIKVLKERIARKDELLQGYERDLAKLRQAETLADHRHQQIEALSLDMRTRTEESQYLRESLRNTKDQLDAERRLNTGIKTKKTFHLENEKIQRNGQWPKHKCRTEDVMGKQNAARKAQQEKIKRKNYEITTLRTELSERDRDLAETHRRMLTVEAAASLEPASNPAIEGLL